MLANTFLHIKGISIKRELDLWCKGIYSWDALETLLPPQASLFKSLSDVLTKYPVLSQSRQALQEQNADFFSKILPRHEHYRIAVAFPANTIFLDIETTGLSKYYDYITLIGWSIDDEYGVYVKGGNDASLRSAIKKAKAIVTFNGAIFDLPFIKQELPNLEMPQAHIDLRFFSKRQGFSGGQKLIENQLGFVRNHEIMGMEGAGAPVLWHKYRRGDLNALKTLIEYNHADIEGMKFIFDKGIEKLAKQSQWPISGNFPGIFSKSKNKMTWRKNQANYVSENIRITPYKEKVAPFITINDLIDTNAKRKLRVVGIDLCSSETKPSGWCFLDGHKADTKMLSTNDELISEVRRVKPHVVSIDSPLSLPTGRVSVYDNDPGRLEYGIMRDCERELKKRGVNVYPALIPSMQRLTLRGINLAKRFRELGIPVIESYPGAAQDIMNIPRKRAGLEFLKDGLAEFGVKGKFLKKKVSHDELDAITSAIVGVFFWSGYFERLGSTMVPDEALIIPDLRVKPKDWQERVIIGLTGRLSAGKTTASKYFERYGYYHGRYSKVVEEILKERGKERKSRKLLQDLGEELHNNPGQRWLGRELIKRFPEEGDVVVDGVRFPEDRAVLIETFGPAFYHIHIHAAPRIRKQRFVKREEKIGSFKENEAHKVERNIDALEQLSDQTIKNESSLEDLQKTVERTVCLMEVGRKHAD